LFSIFLKAGLAFGGGLGILAVLEDELVSKRHAVSRDEFLSIYGIARIVPSGTMTALAVAYGYKFGGLSGTVIALTALSLPVFVLTIALTIAYRYLRNSRLFDLLPVTIMPAALALFLRLNPALILLAGGALGALVLQKAEEQNDTKKKGSEK